jgi:hypothetical protein
MALAGGVEARVGLEALEALEAQVGLEAVPGAAIIAVVTAV